MTILRNLLLGFAAGAAANLLSGAAEARTISNTASIGWSTPRGPVTVLSNRVDIELSTPPSPLEAGIFRVSEPGSGLVTRVDGSGCVAAGGTAFAEAAPPSNGNVSIAPADRFSAGETVMFAVRSAADNRDNRARETLSVVVHAANGDEEQLNLLEDAENSGFFVGYLPTVKIPPALVQRDCRLSVTPGQPMRVTLRRGGTLTDLTSAVVDFMVDPFGIVFDSGNGEPVPGVRVTIVDAATGQPAQVFGDDGVSLFPSSVITGSTVTDSGGTVYTFPSGDYRFPLLARGDYRLVVEPVAPYRWPSSATPAELADFRRPDNGEPYTLTTGSYGAVFRLETPAPVRIDIPIDRPGTELVLRKETSTTSVVPGDTLLYRITVSNPDARRRTGNIVVTDRLPPAVRLRTSSLRYNGNPIAESGVSFSSDGRSFSVTLPPLAGGGSGILSYIGEVRPDARPGEALNIASASDGRGTTSNVAEAAVRIRRDTLGDRITLIGRISAGGCAVRPDAAEGVGGVRVMMQDGRFAVTDSDGRYHFEGLLPGLHVVQIDPASLPPGHVAVDCARNNRSAGSAISRFVEGRGGELKRADFRIVPVTSDEAPVDVDASGVTPLQLPSRAPEIDDAAAAGAGRDFVTGEGPGIAWLFPAEDYNPRAPTTRIAIKHLAGQSVSLTLNGAPVDPLNFDGLEQSPDRSFAVAQWRGVELPERVNRFVATVRNADGSVAETIERVIHYSGGAFAAQLLNEQSLLVADGLNRPVLAVRFTDRDGRPVRSGTVGDIAVQPPHRAAIEADAEQERQLSGLDSGRATWRVAGDDGIAYIELEPTTSSGTARIGFTFRDEQSVRQQQIDAWLNPGDRPWTVVGFAAGTIGYNTLDDRMEPVAETLSDENVDGRIALYAKGRILGQWLMTLAYDSDKQAEEARFGSVIDPRAYYTIYADRADQGFDAASVRNLYLRLERPQFYALFGDFETAINEPELARYQRSMNGVKAEYGGANLAATAFVADTPYRYRRDEFQGNGLSGPYPLSARDILANSERVRIEVRDRLRPEIIISEQTLSRHIDYDIDYFAGTLRFREPVLSRDFDLNPRFIVVDYEVDGVGERVTNAGGRLRWQNDDESLRVGATLLHDTTETARTTLAGVDVRYRPTPSTEVRAEYASSDAEARRGAGFAGGRASAWLLEAEHHSGALDLLVYARERQAGFGVGQLTGAGDGTRKFGFDAQLRAGTHLSFTASGWHEEYLARDARRQAARIMAQWRTNATTLRAGLTFADDRLSTGESNRSSIVQFGATQRFFGQRLEVDASTEFALSGNDDSVDFPARHRLAARFALSSAVALVGAYEVTDGGTLDAETLRAGFDVRPWEGGRITASGNQQAIGELGSRTFAAYGLTQSFQISEQLSIDATLDGQRTMGGVRASDILDPAHPVASGGFLDGYGSITEDFLAVTAGATWRNEDWSITGRAEYRDGELADRYGATLGALRRIGEGSAFGGLLTWAKAEGTTLASTEVLSAEVSWAHRPADSRWSFLNKLEFRLDRVDGARTGERPAIGGPALTITGDARSRRLVNSLAINWSPMGERDGLWGERGEYGLFWGVRHSSDRIGEDDVAGWSTIVGLDLRFDLAEQVGVGVSGNVRTGTDARATVWTVGPQVVVTPFENANLVLGYNINGFRDRDFEESRYTRSGVYATFRLKFDQTSLRGLGL